jgi:dCTP diphosphatase
VADSSLAQLAARLDAFVAERDWAQFHTPRHLVVALVAEVGELAEQFLWMDDAAVQVHATTEPGRTGLSDELADVLIYLLRLSGALHIDLDEAVTAKIDKNARRYPVAEVRGSSAKRP